jgi:NitT/TauT family transport system substrate-binding protein
MALPTTGRWPRFTSARTQDPGDGMDGITTLGRRRFLTAMGVLSSVPVLAACGADDGEGGAAGPIEVRVGVLPIVGAAPLTLAAQEGLFAAGGLAVRPERVQSGAVALPALVAGDLDVLFGNHVSTIAARSQNLDVVIIAEASRARPDNFSVVTLPGSAIQRPTDLAGRTIGINALNNIGGLTVSAVAGAEGIPPDQLTFVEIPFPDMANALANGRVEAAFLPEPFLSEARRTLAVRTVLDPCSGPTADLPIDGYVVTSRFAEENPDTVRAFRDALVEAQRRCADRTVLEPLLVSSAGISPETAARISASAYPTTTEAAQIQRVADLMLQFGALTRPMDVNELVRAA